MQLYAATVSIAGFISADVELSEPDVAGTRSPCPQAALAAGLKHTHEDIAWKLALLCAALPGCQYGDRLSFNCAADRAEGSKPNILENADSHLRAVPQVPRSTSS